MAESRLRAWLAGDPYELVWVEFEDYARRVFARAGDDWYVDPTRYARALIQAQSALASDCLSVDLLAPYVADVAVDKSALLRVLDDARSMAFVDQALDALLHRFAGKLDVILLLRTPFDLLGGGADIGFDDLDDLAVALAGLIRRYADRPVSGLLLERHGDGMLSADEADAYEPLIGTARHYQWLTALSLAAVTDGVTAPSGLDLDLLLLPATPLAQIPEPGPLRCAGGLDDAFWRGRSTAALDAGMLAYGRIPAAAEPETVLSVLRTLRT
jgi:hypothetical protein